MKKIILLLGLIISVSAFSQNKEILKNINDVRFYGVDYSKVKVAYAGESASQFKDAFEEINNLFISEPKKYNPSKLFKKNALSVEIEPVIKNIRKIDLEELKTVTQTSNDLSQADLENVLKSLDIKPTEEPGLIIIAEFLDKTKNRGWYNIVFFDTKTKKIIDTWKGSGKAAGFGLRNFWAASVYKVMKDVKL